MGTRWKQKFFVKVVSNGKRLCLDIKTDSAKDFWVKVEKLELLESFEDSRELKELLGEFLEERGGMFA